MAWVCRLLLVSMAVLVAGEQPCVDYIAIDEDRRSTKYNITVNYQTLSDTHLIVTGKYYRFTSYVGEQIPRGPVENNHCGTVYPIFMLGLHPTPEEGDSSRRVCARDFDQPECFWEETIEVHFCTNDGEAFVVYRLVAPQYADMAYCAGEGAPCIDRVWIESIQACGSGDTYPVMTVPWMDHPRIQNTEQLPDQTCFDDPLTSVSQFGFDCYVGYPFYETDNGARFLITWFADDVILLTLTLNSTHLQATLMEDDLTTHFGAAVFCQVRSYWLDFENQTSYWSDPIQSNHYQTGVYAVSNDIILDETSFPQIHPIELRSTVPVTCWRCLEIMRGCRAPECGRTCILAKRFCSHPCSVFATVQSTGVTSTCELRLSERYSFIDVQIPGAVAVGIAFIRTAPFFRTRQPSPFDEYTIDPIPVRIKDAELDGICTLTGSLDIRTFDATYYQSDQPGDFLLFAALGFIEIQGRFSRCGAGACVCGVAVREFNNVISVDRCHKTFTQIVEHLTDDKPGMAITPNNYGSDCEIRLTSGVVVTVWQSGGQYMDVYINTPSSFKNKSAFGLCGNFDGVRRNDLMIRNSQTIAVGSVPVNFTNSYRIPPPQSYFVVPPTARDNFAVESTMCDCQNGTVVCQDVTNSWDGLCVAGFKRDGCVFDLSHPLSVVDSEGRGLCDVTIRACRQTRLYGANIWTIPECRVSTMEEHAGGERMVTVLEDSAIYISSTEVTCNLPESPLHSPSYPDGDQNSGFSRHTWWISLTNDRVLYSQAYPYTIYDSHCQSCHNSTSCFQKPSTCNINRYCFAHLDQHENDICRQCRADVSMTSWSYKVNSPPVVTTASISSTDDSGRLQLEPMDAEGHNFTFRLVSGTNAAVTEDGILTWEAGSSNDGDIEIQVRDMCGATAAFTVRRQPATAKSNKFAIIVPVAVVVVGILVAALVGLVLLVKHRRRRQDDNAHPDPPDRQYEEINLSENDARLYCSLNPM